MSKGMYNYMRKAIKAARELGYPDGVKRALSCARSESEISRIMTNAREHC